MAEHINIAQKSSNYRILETHLHFWNSQTLGYEKSKMQVLKSFSPLPLNLTSQVCPFSLDKPYQLKAQQLFAEIH